MQDLRVYERQVFERYFEQDDRISRSLGHIGTRMGGFDRRFETMRRPFGKK